MESVLPVAVVKGSRTPVMPPSCKPQRLFKLASIEGADGDEVAIDVQRWDFALALVGLHDDFRRPWGVLDIDFLVADTLLRQEHLGHAAITAPTRGIYFDFGHV